ETSEPTSFDYLDGKNQPVGFFRSLINSLYEAAAGDTRTSHALVKHNYQRLLDKIDSGSDRYSPMEYWRALHNPDYRDTIQKTIVKHPSDWYFKKGDAIWQPFLNALKKEAPEWKKYSEDFLDKMAWMQDVTTEKLGPSLWHMHPIMFLDAIKPKQRYIINYTQYSNTLEEAINKQMAIPGSAAPKWGISRNATRNEVVQHITPSNLTSNNNMLQFLEIDKPMGIALEKLEAFLKGKGSLEGTAAAFIQAAQDYGINECYLAAHAALETGNGTSVLGRGSSFSYNHQPSRTVYNMYGIAAVDGNAVGGGKATAYSRGWFTPESAIRGGAEWISRNFVHKKQNTLYKMRWNPAHPASHQYATDVNWPEHISSGMYAICGDYHDYDKELIFDLPVYK
ncbi:N-acetylglucosaminidase, partial [Enterobacter ludwigii]